VQIKKKKSLWFEAVCQTIAFEFDTFMM